METSILENVIRQVIEDSIQKGALGVALVGSITRDEADVYSDVDFHLLVAESPAERRQLFYIEERLISVLLDSVDHKEKTFADPQVALWNLLAIRDARIVHDPERILASLQDRARAFQWESVQHLVPSRISKTLFHTVELLHKLMGGLLHNNGEKAHLATLALSWNMTEIAALAHGILIPSENRFWSTVHTAVPDVEWRTCQTVTLGLEGETIRARGRAALRLYRRTFECFNHHMQPEHLAVIQRGVQLLDDFLRQHPEDLTS